MNADAALVLSNKKIILKRRTLSSPFFYSSFGLSNLNSIFFLSCLLIKIGDIIAVIGTKARIAILQIMADKISVAT